MRAQIRIAFKLKAASALIINAGAVISLVAMAQANDLADPRLQAHAFLAQNNPPGRAVMELLANGHAVAAAKGIPWKGLDLRISASEALPPIPLDQALSQLLQKQTCRADAIVIGHTSASAYHLSASQAAVYGDYVIVLESVVKENLASPIGSRGAVIVTRPGGALVVSGDPVDFETSEFPRLQANTSYLQFLRYIPESGAYQPVNSVSTLKAVGGNWVPLKRLYSAVLIPGFSVRVVASTIADWIGSCK